MNWIASDPAVIIFATLFIGLVLVVAALPKLQHLDEFQGVVENYRILPGFMVAPFAKLLPLLELVCAVALLITPVREIAAWFATGLFVMFALALAINVGRGRTHIDCGCVRRPTSKSRIGMFHISRALLLAALSTFVALSSVSAMTVPVASWMIGIASAVLLTMMYIAADAMVGLPNEQDIKANFQGKVK